MIITELYKGQGLGNQLWCYVTTRVLALDKGFGFGIQSPENFKGRDFMNLDFGNEVLGGEGPEGGPPTTLPVGIKHYYSERRMFHPNGSDIRMRDERLAVLPDNTKIDGCLQDETAIEHRKDEIRSWLAVDADQDCYDYSKETICVINFRGGGYVREKDFFLPKSYWEQAIANMRNIRENFQFVVITDDVKTAKIFFPDFDVFHFSIAKDYVVIKNAKYLILSNSSFAWFPAWLSTELRYCIAPKYWGRHNVSDGYWSLGYNITKGWMYQDREGNLQDYATCIAELNSYMEREGTRVLREPEGDEVMTPAFAALIRQKKKRPFIGKVKMKARSVWNHVVRNIVTATGIEAAIERAEERKLRKMWQSPAAIREYRKSINVYDIFGFFDELDILELRLNILDPVVDYFVIVEATETFTGKSKPLYYEENKDRFKKWEHKIIHYVLDDLPKDEADLRKRLYERKDLSALDRQIISDCLTSDNVAGGASHWLREFYQKEETKKALVNLNDNDICFVSDVDEIWNPELEIDFSQDTIFKPRQVAYVYYLNNRSNEDWRGWTGTIATKYKNIRFACLNHLRTARKNKYTVLQNGGWHFTFQGGAEKIRTKLASYGHQELNTPEIVSNAEDLILYNKDIWGRRTRYRKDERELPAYLLTNRKHYKHLLLP